MDCPILRIGLSGFSPLDHYRLGQCIAQAVENLGCRAVFIASGDLSHKLRDDGPYGFAPEGPEFDRQITEAMAEGDFLHFLTMDPSLCDRAAEQCHVEVTTLLIPGENDSEEEIRSLTRWLASVDRDIPLHLSRFFPQYRMMDRPPTSVERVYRLADVARGCLSCLYRELLMKKCLGLASYLQVVKQRKLKNFQGTKAALGARLRSA